MSADANGTVPSQSIACQADVAYLRTRNRWTRVNTLHVAWRKV